MPSFYVGNPVKKHNAVLGQKVLQAIHQDMSNLELPTWVNAAPLRFGLKSHGKLSADQWRSACLINLPITLIRLWGNEGGRKEQMLQNFLCLVAAVDLATSKTVSPQTMQSYNDLMMGYLSTMKVLYPEAPLQPKHHWALHMPDFMKNFGPAHATQTFGFERMNYLQQSTNTNWKFGQCLTPSSFHDLTSPQQERWSQHL
jgi:hypothetical protein